MLPNFKTTLAVLGLTQADLSFELKIPASTLSEFIRGRRNPNASTRRRIARRLHADEKWLFCREFQIPEPKNPGGEEEFLKAT